MGYQPPAAGIRAAARLRNIDAFIDAHLAGPLHLADLAACAFQSPFHFLRAFRAITGPTPHEYVTACRMNRARSVLLAPCGTAARAAESVG